jgi:hypothetical protein
VGEVLGEHGLADAAGADEDDVDVLAEEVEVEEGFDRVAVDLPRVGPVEVGDRLEDAEGGVADPALEAAATVLAQLEWDTPRSGRTTRGRRAHEQEDTPSSHP